MRTLLLSTALVFCAASPAPASSSAWYETEGARLRIVTSGQPDATGKLQGALEIELDPGWKTYWRDPGASGVPPSIDISDSSNITSIDMAYPAPMRFDDASGPWVGYKHSPAFPVTFQLAAPDQPSIVATDVFVGVCETICVPVRASFSVDPASDPENPEDAAIVSAALGALPSRPEDDFGVTLLSIDEDRIVVEAKFPGDAASADFFLAGTEDYSFGAPQKDVSDGKVTFTVPILGRPADKPAGEGLPYTLVTQAGAVAGELPYP